MPDTKLSAMTAAGSLADADLLYTVQGGAQKKGTVGQVRTGIAIAGVTGLQAALDAKAALAHTHVIDDVTDLQDELDLKADAASLGALAPLDEVTNAQVAAAAAIALSKLAAVTADRALVSDGSGVIVPSAVTAAELAHVGGVTSAIQTQLNAKAALAHTHVIGDTTGLQAALDAKQAQDADLDALAALTTTGVVKRTGAGAFAAAALVNADVDAAAAIAFSKMAALTASRALASDGSGVVSVATTTLAELNFVSGVTSAIQTQLGTKVTNPMTTADDLIKGGASGAPARLAKGADGEVLTMVAGAVAWAAAAGGSSPPFTDTTSIVKGSADATKLLRFEVDGFTTGTTRVATWPNADITVARIDAAQTFTGVQTFSSSPTSPGSGADSEHFGSGAATSTFIEALAVGQGAAVVGNSGTAVGRGTQAGIQSIAIGRGALADAQGNIVIGYGAWTGGTVNNVIVIGQSATAENGANRFVAGSGGAPMTEVFFGKGRSNSSPTAYTIFGTSGSGSNIAGAGLNLCAGRGTGTGAGGVGTLQGTVPGSSGSSLNTVANALRWLASNAAMRVAISVANSAPTDADIANGEVVAYLDQTANNLLFRVRYSDGTLKLGTVALA